MSHAATKWAFDQPELNPDMKPGEWAVLMVLADCHNPVQGCFPSQDYICRKTNLSERTVREQLTRLRARALVNWDESRVDGRRDTNRYCLAFEGDFQPADSAGSSTGNPQPEQPADSDTDNRQNLPPDSNHVREPVTGTIEKDARASAGQQADPAAIPDANLLADLRRDHPQAAHADQDAVTAIWRAMSRDQRRASVRWHAAWLGDRGPRQAVLGLEKYLGQRPWEIIAAKAEAARTASGWAIVEAFSRAWWWLWFDVLMRAGSEAGRADSPAHQLLGNRASGAIQHIGWMVDAGQREALDAAAERMIQIGRDSPQAAAWAASCRELGPLSDNLRRGVRMPIPDAAPFIWVPSEWPARQQAPMAMSDDDRGVEL